MTRRRKVLILSTLSIAVFLLLAVVLELVAGWLGHRGSPSLSSLLPWVPHAERGYSFKPDMKFRYLATTGWVEGTTDAKGFRPVLSCRDRSDSAVVVCLGDSTTFGAESPDDGTWPEAASRALLRRGIACRMMNRGIRGYSAVQCLATLRETLRQGSPALPTRAVVYLFCANDPAENFEPGRPRLDAAQFVAGAPSAEVAILPPGALAAGESRPSLPEGPRNDWAARHGRPSILSRVREGSALLAAIRYYRRGTSPASFRKEGVSHLEMFADCYREFLSKPHLQDGMRYALREMAAECKSRGLAFFVASWVIPAWEDDAAGREFLELSGWPASKLSEQAASYQAACDLLKKMTGEAGGTYIELRNCLSGMLCREYAASARDWHYSVAANDRFGKRIAESVAPRLEPGK